MKGKRSYQAAMVALDTHYGQGKEKDSGRFGGDQDREESLGWKDTSVEGELRGSTSCPSTLGPSICCTFEVVGKERKSEALQDKRRKIKEQGELLDASLAEESSHLTAVLEHVVNALVSVLVDSNIATGSESFTDQAKNKSPVQEFEETERHLGS
ncbi:hypothetical protein L873DRAFT_117588 [Choiromyces venosus 120613-1]|uniref:Uncharacterized protein n=1 Tax=Choiromyces venosus 120613-1 TaxID=1336337 RepID=A0A3N4J8J6_9PEZI|nr:hypothetical protein L873DRAFT_117588 [Choiromyces venosus 120613-1]